jgi:hypothetical protein
VFEHRHLERYGDQAERMRSIIDRRNGADTVLHAYHAALTTTKASNGSKAA